MTILVLTTADTEILALRSIADGLPVGFPSIRAANPTAAGAGISLEHVDCVIVRLLGGRQAWSDGFDDLRARCVSAGIPLLAFGGESVPDGDLAGRSTVPSATIAQAFEYLAHGGLHNTEQLLRFVADTVLMGGWGFDPPAPIPSEGVWRQEAPSDPRRPVVGVVFYRAHVLSGNTTFVDDLAEAIQRVGGAPRAVWCYSLRPDGEGRVPAVDLLRGVDVVITTVLAAGTAADDQWDAGELATLDVSVLQAVCATSTAAAWRASTAALAPIDVALGVAIPEFDGRLITVPVSTKEVVDDGDTLGSPVMAYRVMPDRAMRVAELAVRLGSLRSIPVGDRRVAVVLSAYPTRRSRLGNAVGLDTPASVIALLAALRGAGYRVDRIPADGDALMAELADGLTYDHAVLSKAQVDAAPWRWSAEDYRRWWSTAPAAARAPVEQAWGPAPGTVSVDPAGGAPVFSGLDLGGVIVTVQPPRGFGEASAAESGGMDPIAVYHSPDLPPTHHYLGFYRWLDMGWGADAVIHVGKHGTLEWLPGKGVGLSEECYPDLALGSLPLIYPFVVNDPGEATQAKRRAHAVIIDHLVPPMTRADSYDHVARLEALLDEHAQIAALDPSKLATIRQQVWELVVDASLHRDLGWAERPGDDEFDDAVLHLDGYLCELKDAQIRGGLHVLGVAPTGDALVEMVLAMTRLPQGAVPALRPAAATRADADELEAGARARIEDLRDRGWAAGDPDPTLDWVGRTLVPALRRTDEELTAVLRALDGRFVTPGPSGAPTRGMAHVLPTGRNLYSIDPKAVPSRLAWGVGCQLAAAVCERHLAEAGRLPETVGIVLWGTAAMRTAGDDVAEALALLGVRPLWAPESPRVVGLEPIPLVELGRPRIDVTLRISGFFRDAFPHLIHLVDDAVEIVAGLEEADEDNYVRAHVARDGIADPRIFGAKPGAYGSGVLNVLESGNWRSDDDLASVYTAWSGWSYGRSGMGMPAVEAMARRFTSIEVAVKNQDNREHDIFDSDDYLQDHGGMIATVRSLRSAAGLSPSRSWFGDSSDPARPRVRSLAEEAARVVRTRVVNPKWLAAMQRHGYKGAFEMAATVDYIFGYDATAGVVEDWMYEQVTSAYVGDAAMRKFFEQSNPWALRAIAQRLLEAVDRGLWAEPTATAVATLRAAVLEAEGWEEDR